jgi:hypothetical protein
MNSAAILPAGTRNGIRMPGSICAAKNRDLSEALVESTAARCQESVTPF